MYASPSPDQRLTLLPSTLAAALCILWGANTVAIKFTLSGLGSCTAAVVRFGLAALCLGAWIRLSGRTLRLPAGHLRALWVNSLGFSLQVGLLYIGFSYTNASRGALLTNLQPFFLLFLAHFFLSEDRITPLKFAGLVLGFTGAAFVFLDRPGMGGDFMRGDLLVLVSTLTWAWTAVHTKRLVQDISALHIAFYQLLFSIPVFGIGAWLWDSPRILRIDAALVAALLFQIVFTTCFAFVAWNSLMRKHGAVALHAFIFLIPVSGVLLAGVVLGEPIGGLLLAALVLIAGGILLVQLGQSRALAQAAGRQAP